MPIRPRFPFDRVGIIALAFATLFFALTAWASLTLR